MNEQLPPEIMQTTIQDIVARYGQKSIQLELLQERHQQALAKIKELEENCTCKKGNVIDFPNQENPPKKEK